MIDKLKPGDIVEGTFGKMEFVQDFLPRPEDLVLKKEPATEKITMELEKETVDFFRGKAKTFGASYQRMIRKLLSEYVAQQSELDRGQAH